MTIKEYVKAKGMTYAELAKLVGCSGYTISTIANRNTAVKDSNYLRRFEELGIEVKAYNPKLNKKREVGVCYLYYEKLQIASVKIGDIYCYTLDKLNAVTQYLNGRRICYYVIPKDDYWVVKYDKTIKKEEWVQ